MRSCCQTRLSRNLFVGDGALDVPFGNIAKSPKVEKNADFSRRGVEGAAPYISPIATGNESGDTQRCNDHLLGIRLELSAGIARRPLQAPRTEQLYRRGGS